MQRASTVVAASKMALLRRSGWAWRTRRWLNAQNVVNAAEGGVLEDRICSCGGGRGHGEQVLVSEKMLVGNEDAGMSDSLDCSRHSQQVCARGMEGWWCHCSCGRDNVEDVSIWGKRWKRTKELKTTHCLLCCLSGW